MLRRVCMCVCVCTIAGVGHSVRQGIGDQARDQPAVCGHISPREDHSLQPQEHQERHLRHRQGGMCLASLTVLSFLPALLP